MSDKKSSLIALVLCLVVATGAWSQGVQTATLNGNVTSSDGQAMPGVTVTATSAALLGERATVTGVNGDYILRGLPPGSYKVVFALEGMQSIERQVTLELGAVARSDAELQVAAAEETIVVTGEAPSALETTQVGANFKADEVAALPMNRTTLGDLAAYAPGLTNNTPNAGQVTISGGFAFDNVFLVNGVDVNDNLFGTAHNLFIEEAIAETQVLTSGISAEYGRFSGGVINTITKSGGNTFAASVRADYSKPEWRDETPLEKSRGQERTGDLSKFYQATFGGPIVKDRLWFFLAGRDESSTTANTFVMTGIPYNLGVENERYEVKLTGNLTTNHSLQASYTNNETAQNGRPGIAAVAIEPRVLVNRTLPNELTVVNYSGIYSNNLFGEARWSEKIFGFRNTGGTSLDIQDSPFRARGVTPGVIATAHYNAPFFDSNDPEDRNNEQLAASLSYFLSSERIGTHDVKFGAEQYTSSRTGGNSQSSTGYVFQVDPVMVGGQVQFDSQGRVIPNFVNGVSRVQNWIATRGAQVDLETTSFFINDRWSLGRHWSFNLGVRYEQVRGEATGGLVTADTDAIVPRLGISYDLFADGRFKFDATYAQYAGKYSESQFARNTVVGSPSLITRTYTGPSGQGMDFAPGFNLNNYTTVVAANVPTANVIFDRDLKSPTTDEITLAAGMALSRGGYAKLIYTDREVSDFVEDFINIGLGKVTAEIQGTRITLDNRLFQNTDVPQRKYQALQLQSRYSPFANLTLDLGWTYQLKNEGNFEGEAANQPGNPSVFGDNPEMLPLSRYEPYGRINDFQEHKLRLAGIYNWNLGSFGRVDLGLIWRYDSPLTFSYIASAASLSPELRAKNPGYAIPPTTQNLYFGARGIGEYDSSSLFDFAMTYSLPIWKTLTPWVRLEVRNFLNEEALISFSTTVTPDATSPKDEFGLPTGFVKSSTFGQATSSNNYANPREYFLAAGIRF